MLDSGMEWGDSVERVVFAHKEASIMKCITRISVVRG